MTAELNALTNLRQNFNAKYKTKMPELHCCETPSLAQVAADDFYLKFITETLEVLGETRSKKIL